MFIIRYPTLSVDISRLIIYYTDGHEVDEDRVTVAGQGGYWPEREWAGIAQRHLFDSPTNVYDGVA